VADTLDGGDVLSGFTHPVSDIVASATYRVVCKGVPLQCYNLPYQP
jgi:hypothetical protein